MEPNRSDDAARVFRELDEVLNETARLQQAVQEAQHPPDAAKPAETLTDDDRRRYERRGVVDTRRHGDRRADPGGRLRGE